MALGGQASIQGSTDIPTLYNILPGYLTMPHTEHYGGLEAYIEKTTAPAGWWGKADTYIVSLLKAWWGPAATKENDFCFDYLPRIDDDNSNYWTVEQMLQWNHKAVEPKEDCRSELWFYYHLGKKIKERLKGSVDPKNRPILDLTWEYPEQGQTGEPSASAVLREISGSDDKGQLLSAYKLLKADGSTSCGCWIYCGAYADGINMTAR